MWLVQGCPGKGERRLLAGTRGSLELQLVREEARAGLRYRVVRAWSAVVGKAEEGQGRRLAGCYASWELLAAREGREEKQRASWSGWSSAGASCCCAGMERSSSRCLGEKLGEVQQSFGAGWRAGSVMRIVAWYGAAGGVGWSSGEARLAAGEQLGMLRGELQSMEEDRGQQGFSVQFVREDNSSAACKWRLVAAYAAPCKELEVASCSVKCSWEFGQAW